MKTEVLFSSRSDEWETPQDLFDSLDDEFHFTLDPASTDENAKCEYHFTKAENGLEKNWGGHTVFCNPPYGRGIKTWVEKGYTESKKPETTVVMLLPARTDTRWFHEYCCKGKIRFFKGRLRFGNATENAPFPSMLVIFGGYHNETHKTENGD